MVGEMAVATLDSAPGREAGRPDGFDAFLDAPPTDQPSRDDGSLFQSVEVESDSGLLIELEPRVGRYQVLGLVGEGRYARVYKGYDPFLERSAAVKVLRSGSLGSDKMKERFLSEARALARLPHPRIVPFFEAGRDADLYYIAMALIEGENLGQLQARHRELLGPRRAAELVADLADALAYTHRHGIVHRDVKPENIQVDHCGRVYLMDFGIASRTDSGELSVNPGSTLTGTPAYLAPELASGDPIPILPTIDQYSLGVVFYELLCGRTPFSGHPLYVLFQAAHEDPPSPRSIEPTVPTCLADICLKALSRCPEQRYPSCDHISAGLRSWLGASGEERS